MNPPDDAAPQEEELSDLGRDFLDRRMFPGALWLGLGLLALILAGVVASFFIKAGPGGRSSLGGTVIQMFLRP